MKIGIIGAGHIGGALTRRFRAAGHEVTVANSRGPASLSDLARETGALAGSIEAAAHGNDIVVVAIPTRQIENLPPGLFTNAPADMIIIDANNYYPRERDGLIEGIEASATESGWLEHQLGHPVVKVFNTIIAQHLQENGKPSGTPGRIALAIAGDNPNAKATVTSLVDEIGFDGVDAGMIDESWRQQPGSPGYLKDYDAQGVRQALAEASKERALEWRGTPNSPGTYDSPA